MFQRNKLFASAIAVVAFCTSMLLLGMLFAIVIPLIISHVRNKRKRGITIKTDENGKVSEIKFGTKYPIKKIVGDVNLGDDNNVCSVYLRNGKVKFYNFKKRIIQKNIKEQPNVAVFIMNSDPNRAGEPLTDVTYQRKYGVCQTFDRTNCAISIRNFINDVKKNKNINTIKLQLLNHGREDFLISKNNPQNINEILDQFGKSFIGKNNMNIIVNNFACFGANRFGTEVCMNKENEKIEDIVKRIAKKYNNINFFYQKHNDKKTMHYIVRAYDKKKDFVGLSHFTYDYYYVTPDGTFSKIDKETKYNLLNGQKYFTKNTYEPFC